MKIVANVCVCVCVCTSLQYTFFSLLNPIFSLGGMVVFHEGREEEASGRKTSEEVPARGEVAVAGGSEPEGRDERFLSL